MGAPRPRPLRRPRRLGVRDQPDLHGPARGRIRVPAAATPPAGALFEEFGAPGEGQGDREASSSVEESSEAE